MESYPKRLYIAGKGYTVQNAEEEHALTGVKPMSMPVPSCVEQKVEDAELTNPIPYDRGDRYALTEELPDEVSPVQRQVAERAAQKKKQEFEESLKKSLDNPAPIKVKRPAPFAESKKRSRPKGSKGKR